MDNSFKIQIPFLNPDGEFIVSFLNRVGPSSAFQIRRALVELGNSETRVCVTRRQLEELIELGLVELIQGDLYAAHTQAYAA